MVSLSLLGVILLVLSGCSGWTTDDTLNCPDPTPTPGQVDSTTPTATCTTSSGAHFYFIPHYRGWFPEEGNSGHPDWSTASEKNAVHEGYHFTPHTSTTGDDTTGHGDGVGGHSSGHGG